MRSFGIMSAVLALMVLVAASTIVAEVPRLVNYQGRLTNDEGIPLDTTVSITFAIYESETDKASLWDETHSSVAVANGGFSVLLGSVFGFPEDIFDGNDRWLGIKIGDDAELTPRALLGSVPLAFRAHRADTAGFALTCPPSGVEGVIGGRGLYGGGWSGTVILDVGAGPGIKLHSHTVEATLGTTIETDEITDGTVLFEDLAQNGASNGQVMKWNGSAWVADDDETGGTSIDSTTRYYGIPACSFNGDAIIQYADNRAYNDDYDYAYAPVQLPHGAHVSRVVLYSGDSNADFTIYRYRWAAPNEITTMGSAHMPDPPDSGVISSISDAIIDNEEYAYQVKVRFGYEGYQRFINGVRIEYVIEETLP